MGRFRILLLVAVLVSVVGCSPVGSDGSPTTSGAKTTPTTGGASTTTAGMDVSGIFDVTDWIAYQGSGLTGASEAIILVHPDGTGAHEIDDDIDGYGQLPDWSPDGTKVVMTPRGPFPETLYEYDLESESARVLFECTDPCFGDDEPAYSPDATRVAFIRALGPWDETLDAPSDCGLWIGEIATGEVEQITTNEGCDREYNPRWSPDGMRIAYARFDGPQETSTAVFVIDLGTREETQLTEWDLAAGYPDWSPDGKWILFTSHPFFLENNDGPISNLYRMHPDGTGVEQLTFYNAPNPRPNQPRYKPDGKWIVFTMDTGGTREIWVMPAEGGEPVALVKGGIHTHPAWQPAG